MSYKGRYIPTNPKKYKGDPQNIIYRSLWERKFMVYCDTSKAIIEWGSEEIIIPYISPWDNKVHRYFPDFWIKVQKANGTIEESLIEIKPKSQCSPPRGAPPKDGRKRRRFIREVKTWGRNEAKWKAAKSYCDDRNWKWTILTEDNLTKY